MQFIYNTQLNTVSYLFYHCYTLVCALLSIIQYSRLLSVYIKKAQLTHYVLPCVFVQKYMTYFQLSISVYPKQILWSFNNWICTNFIHHNKLLRFALKAISSRLWNKLNHYWKARKVLVEILKSSLTNTITIG